MIAYLFVNQNGLLYVPKHPQFPRQNRLNPKGYKNPSEIGLKYENVHFQTEDGIKLNAWLIFSSENAKSAPTLLYFHGNAGNIGLRMPNYRELVNRCKANVFAVEYRGYGDSQGEPSERGLSMDGIASWKYLMSRGDVIDTSKVVIFGRSLGGAVATHLAWSLENERKKKNDEEQPRALLLENTFTSVQEMAMQLFPLLRVTTCIMDRLLENKWLNKDKIEDVMIPILFLSGAKDNIVPPSHMVRLHGIASKRKNIKTDMVVFPESGHNDIPFTDQGKSVNLKYFGVITDFLQVVS
ncbi:alpha/beta hydrolase [bacterium]|nr:alpha/beta hydrolase [bacterium]